MLPWPGIVVREKKQTHTPEMPARHWRGFLAAATTHTCRGHYAALKNMYEDAYHLTKINIR